MRALHLARRATMSHTAATAMHGVTRPDCLASTRLICAYTSAVPIPVHHQPNQNRRI